MEGSGKSNYEEQIEELCVQMEETASFLRDKIKPETKSVDDDEEEVSEQITELRQRICRLKSTLLHGPAEEHDEMDMITLSLSLLSYSGYSYCTFQIYSIKITDIKGGLDWPLSVYGVIAARDRDPAATVDHPHNRNILFCRPREACQKLTPQDPYLHLIGPSGQVFAKFDQADLKVQLGVKGETRSQDRSLISRSYTYSATDNQGLQIAHIDDRFCTMEISFDWMTNTIQATILGVRVVGRGPWPFKYGGRVVCSSPPREVTEPLSRQVVLVDSRENDDGEMPVGIDGYLNLTRRGVSVDVKVEESLKVVVQAYSQSGGIAAQGHAIILPHVCDDRPSNGTCEICGYKLEITVAWSWDTVPYRYDLRVRAGLEISGAQG